MSDSQKIKELELKIEALRKTRDALMSRVERAIDMSGSSFSVMESNILLQRKVDERTRALSESLKEVSQLANKAEAASQAKSLFLANMSHEIRTPLNSIIGFIDLLSLKELDDESKDYIDIIKSSGNSLLNIINDILDYSKIESGKFEIYPVNFNLRDEVKSTLNTLKPQAQSKKVKLLLNIDNEVPEYLYEDSFRLKQVLMNLLSNAIKFSKENGLVSLTVKYKEKTHSLYMSVEDTGIGISKDKIENVFSVFSQVDNTISRQYGGTGLGVPISKRLIEMMGGELMLETELGKGSKFYFVIPIKKNQSDYVDENKKLKKISLDLSEFTVLVVEDNVLNCKLMEKYLNHLNVSYEFAHNGIEAIEKFEENKFDLIFMDESMPHMTGVEATQKIREIEATRNTATTRRIPIIALSANAFIEDRSRFLESGMDDHLPKPVNQEQILNILTTYLAS